jgi:hypothetical protein
MSFEEQEEIEKRKRIFETQERADELIRNSQLPKEEKEELQEIIIKLSNEIIHTKNK